MASTKRPRDWLRIALYTAVITAGLVMVNPALVTTGLTGVGKEVIDG